MNCLACEVKGKACRYCGTKVCSDSECRFKHFIEKRRRPFEKRFRRYCRKRTDLNNIP